MRVSSYTRDRDITVRIRRAPHPTYFFLSDRATGVFMQNGIIYSLRIHFHQRIDWGLMYRMLILALMLVFSSASGAGTEYNQWSVNDTGILSVITQTEANAPVFVSIAAGGTPGANVVITLAQDTPCDAQQTSVLLWVNNMQQQVNYRCENIADRYLITYLMVDSSQANALYRTLKSGRTVVLDKRIKIWAANINRPSYTD